ncbi:MAG: class I SAM-dependent methyltransferase [Chloroflexi bacterium]|nr:class I SAM-dependent methyltransferase [Chloroflexota bacterium]
MDGIEKEVRVRVPVYYKVLLWKRLAPFYDPLFRLLFFLLGGERQVRQGLVDFAGVNVGDHVLDVGCGTGTLALLLAKRAGPRGYVVGVDLSEGMLAQARRKTNVPWLSFRRANVEELPFPDGSFDKAFMSLSLHEMPPEARHNTLMQVARVLRPDGSLFLLEYHLPHGALARRVVNGFMSLTEEKEARRMVRERRLEPEIEAAGLTVKEHKFKVAGALVMLRAART